MNHPKRHLRSLLALSVLATLVLAPVSQAREPKQAAPRASAKHQPVTDLAAKRGVKRAADRVPTEAVTFNFQKVDAAFNPKEITIDQGIPSP